MKLIYYLSTCALPFVLFLIILFGVIEKKKVFDIFIDGCKEGIEIVIGIFPTLLALFLSIGMLKSSGIIDFIIKLINPITLVLKIPSEVLPLMFLRPISGSAATAITTNIMQDYGVDSKIGLIVSTIMGSTETTLYTIAVYSGCVKIKKIRFVLIVALIADIVGMAISIVFWNLAL